jgi:hypothetical protein
MLDSDEEAARGWPVVRGFAFAFGFGAALYQL